MAQKYYNSADAAKTLGLTVDEVKTMLERRELYGYRDGADWKFKVEDIDRMAKERQAEQPPAAEEDVGDVLLSEVALGQSDMGTSGTVIAMEALGGGGLESDIQLAGSDVKIVEAPPVPKKKSDPDSKIGKFETLSLDDDVVLEDSAPTLRSMPIPAGLSGSAIDLSGKGLDDDDLVLGGSSTGSDVAIGADSGISLIDPADSGLSLEEPLGLGGSSSRLVSAAAAPSSGQAKSDSDFLLTPLEDVTEDGSESGSQVIALDTEADEAASMLGGTADTSMAAMLDEDLSAQPALDFGEAATMVGGPLLGAQPSSLSAATPIQPGAVTFEAPYTTWQITGLAVCSVLLMFCGMMMYDLLRHMWSWGTPYTINSWLMDAILGIFG